VSAVSSLLPLLLGQLPAQPATAVKGETGTKIAAGADGGLDDQGDAASDRGPLDDFVFAPLSTISGIIAALAPLLASPVVDAIRSLLSLGK
jgi:hypothetical protein